jgi:ubiquinone/menaquinone biosynthesis C-methylase UbiE
MDRSKFARMMEEQRQAFIRRTQRYLDLGYDRHAAAAFVAKLTGQAAGPVLDVGTGKGLLAIALARGGLDVVSVDVSTTDSDLAALLAEEAEVRTRIEFFALDASSLPFPDGHFGCIAMMDVLHHLEQGEPVLKEARRTLRPGGTLVVADFTQEGFDLIARVHREDGREHPVGPVTLDWALTWLQGEGLVSGPEMADHLQRAFVFAKAETP